MNNNVDTVVGVQAIKDIQPRSVEELAISSSLMRLMGDGELPLAKYARFKRVPELWYNEMKNAGLNADEIKVLEKYLKKKCGVGESQEVIMQIVMDPQISGFSMKEANMLRKTIAKKKFAEIEKVKALFYQRGEERGSSKALLDYIWDIQINYQLGYSFSEVHTTAYALIALQEANLAARWPIIYWNTACLSVDASAINAQDFYNLMDEDIISIDEVDGKRVQNKMDYAKIAAALDKFKRVCQIELPDINNSRLSFTPNVERNSILYGLKGISQITDPTIEEIMNNRPFNSLEDFLNRISKKVVNKAKVLNLIKCGAFDAIEGKSRREILNNYIWSICDAKTKLTMQNANMLIDKKLLPQELEYYADVYKLTKELRKHRDSMKLWYCGDRLEIPENKFDAWKQILADAKIQGQDMIIDGEPRRVIDSRKWDVFYERNMEPIRKYIKANHDELLQKLNNTLFMEEWSNYCQGDEKQWELDSINFFFSGHPLDVAIPEMKINIDRLDEIVEDAQDGQFIIKGKVIPKMKLYTIAGTVIDKDNTKGMVTIQCPDGVVNVKLFKGLYAAYNKADSETGEESFFEKGVHLLITGIQRGATFVPKVYKSTGRHSISRIRLDEQNHFIGFEDKKVD